MKSLRFVLQTSRRRAFTLVETTIALAVFCAVGLVAFNVLRSGMLLSSQNVGINVSAMRSREIIDQIGERSRYAMEQPSLITATGADASGTTADGISIKVIVGLPYVLKASDGTTSDIPTTATQFVLEFRPDLTPPSVGDYILVESVSRPELEISAVSAMAAVGTTQRRLITTTTAIGEAVRPSYYRLTSSLYRKSAYVFVNTDATTNPRAELRYFYRVRGSTNFSTASNYVVMATGYRRLNNLTYFTSTTVDGANTTVLNAMVNSTVRSETVARGSNVSTYTTLPVQYRLWSVNR